MSGGAFDYVGWTIKDGLDHVADNEDVLRRWPLTASILRELGAELYRIEHDMDWDLSGDTPLRISDEEFDAAVIASLRRVLDHERETGEI